MPEECVVKNTGLRGVKVADTRISFIDGEKGVLIYRGYSIEDLAKFSNFEEVAYLLLKGAIPSAPDLDDFRKRLVEMSVLPDYLLTSMKSWPVDTVPMSALLASTAMLGFSDRTVDNDSINEHEMRAVRLIASLHAAMVAWDRIRRGLEVLTPLAGHGVAANILYGISGRERDPEMVKVLDTCLVLHADHSFNASTFACREVASTKADMYAGVCAGIAALSGPLHGGANEKVMEMLHDLENEQDIDGWVRKEIGEGRKIMGLGHAVYKTTDPRAVILKEMSARLGDQFGRTPVLQLSEEIERAAIGAFESMGKSHIKPNIDFYSAPVYHMIGLPLDLFTPLFAVSRIVGWCAHIMEEKFGLAQKKPSLYRPSAEYIGNYCGLMGCELKRKGGKEE